MTQGVYLALVALLWATAIQKCVSSQFPGNDKFSQIASENILKRVGSDSISQHENGNGYRNYTKKEICTRLSDLHNVNKLSTMGQTNQEFLGLKNPYKEDGLYPISTQGCLNALSSTRKHDSAGWLNKYAGYHVGKLYVF